MVRTKLVDPGRCLMFDKCIMTNFYWLSESGVCECERKRKQ